MLDSPALCGLTDNLSLANLVVQPVGTNEAFRLA